MRDARRLGPLVIVLAGLGMIVASFVAPRGPSFSVGAIVTTTTTTTAPPVTLPPTTTTTTIAPTTTTTVAPTTTTVAPATTTTTTAIPVGVVTVPPATTTTVPVASPATAVTASSGQLPETGAPVTGLLVGGIALVAFGSLLLLLSRSRRASVSRER